MQEGPERIDYQETPDVTEVHAAVKREHSEPQAHVTPIPLWLTALCGLVVFWAGIYLGVFHGGFRGDIFDENQSSPEVLFPVAKKAGGAGAEAAAQQSLAQIGKAVYGNCVPCHQGNGAGVAGQFPPLAASEWAVGGEKRFIAILLKGLQGPITVEGKPFNGAMPAWEKSLSDKKIAAVASYVRSEWGNKAPEISEAKVAAARKEFAAQAAPWTEAELQKIPADATLPDAAGAVPAPSGAAPVPAAPSATGAHAAPAAAASADVVAEGKKQYSAICIACHMPTGLGLPPAFPPLAKSEYVNGKPERFAAMILKGNAGPMTIDGVAYNNVMPGQEAVLTDAKIAAIMTYVRSSFGNNAPAVAAEVVAAARAKFIDRKTPWTEPELKAWAE